MKKLSPLLITGCLAFSACSEKESTKIEIIPSTSEIDKIETISKTVGESCVSSVVYSQNQLPPYGAAVRQFPDIEAEKLREPGFLPNQEVSIRGWVEVEEAAYLENPEPWDGKVWFAVADEDGWVNYAAVRNQPTEIVRLVDGSLVENPPTLEEMSSQLVYLDPACEITK